MPIKQFKATITNTTDLTQSSKEIGLTLDENLEFLPGAFVNIFLELEGVKERRAYSISSSDTNSSKITLSVRKSIDGKISPMFWDPSIIGKELEIMGPLGMNTVDKITNKKVFLFSFGVGVSVVKSIAKYLLDNDLTDSLIIYMGHRNEEEIIYKEFFDSIVNKAEIKYILSKPIDDEFPHKGYIQDFIGNLDFSNSSVYICGQDKACQELKEKIMSSNPDNVQFLIEGFH
jgi:NAD(P)H-flavin reductase